MSLIHEIALEMLANVAYGGNHNGWTRCPEMEPVAALITDADTALVLRREMRGPGGFRHTQFIQFTGTDEGYDELFFSALIRGEDAIGITNHSISDSSVLLHLSTGIPLRVIKVDFTEEGTGPKETDEEDLEGVDAGKLQGEFKFEIKIAGGATMRIAALNDKPAQIMEDPFIFIYSRGDETHVYELVPNSANSARRYRVDIPQTFVNLISISADLSVDLRPEIVLVELPSGRE